MKKLLLFSVLVAITLIFTSTTYSQAQRKVLFENLTSSTCGPCASNNPALRQWISDNWANLTCVSYHVGWPAPGNDPMYLYNQTQSYDRRYYYNVNAVPTGQLMGIHQYVGSPFPWSNMTVYTNYYLGQPTPLSIYVTDTRIANGDSNRVNIQVINYTNLPAGNYYMRVMVVERLIVYQSPPGSNGETQFQNVFRKSIPTSLGTAISTSAGTYNFEFRYWMDHVTWRDTSIYTMAFVQNDVDKTIMNTHRNGMVLTGITPNSNETPSSYALYQNYPNPFNPSTNVEFNIPKDGFVSLKLYDILGNEVKTLVEGNHKAGAYNIFVDGTGLATGVYFYKLVADNFSETKKMILSK